LITDKHGTGCHEFVSPFINNCGYDGAYEALSHIVDQPIRKGKSFKNENIFEFS